MVHLSRRARSFIFIVGVIGLAMDRGLTATRAETLFFEAESMHTSADGWRATENDQTRRASRTRTLWGADGAVDAIATQTVPIRTRGTYRIWVRYLHVAAWRGTFQVTATSDEQPLGAGTFDQTPLPNVADWEYTWQSFTAELPAGEITLKLEKAAHQNCVGYVRHVDCFLLTTDPEREPDHVPYGPQTLLRVTLGSGYDRPVYLHLFADHYRSPWYAHFAIGRNGMLPALAPPATEMMRSGDQTPWCRLTPTIYQDSGAALNFSVRHAYHEKASHFRAKLEFGRPKRGESASSASPVVTRDSETPEFHSETDNVEIVKTFDVEATPNGLVVIAPPDLESTQHRSWLRRDREFAEEVGKLADSFPWPTHGRRPTKFPFLVTASIGGYELPVDANVTRREQQTLDYFGFSGSSERILHGLWHMRQESYCRPDLEEMRRRAQQEKEQLTASGRSIDEFVACMLMDEPTGQPASFLAQDDAYLERFREWLAAKSLTPADLLVARWDDVRPIAEADREKFPALHYYTQLFRTRALGDFMATQRHVIEETYGRTLPTLVNFSDGAVYHANFFGQGVDYFELLDADDQNAIWGEDWANNASTYQCAAFNVALMQAAARRRGQTIGHYLIAHAGRTPWDIKTKAVGETARGVRIWKNFSYGPNWSSHEGGPAWRSHLWHAHTELWTANAEITREIGAVEEWLETARPPKAEVALLYSSSSDAWTMPTNLAFGFDRMHTWLALTHAQVPVDVLPEREFDRLAAYQVCYLSGPNLTRDAAAQLREWVIAGGTLWLSAGAAERDEFNRPLDLLGELAPVERAPLETLETYQNAGKFLSFLKAQDVVSWSGQSLEVLSVKQSLTPRANSGTDVRILATFADGTPAAVIATVGQGRVVISGFLPALSYIKPALQARQASEKLASNPERIERSHNPWQFPATVRQCLLTPCQSAHVAPPLACDTPLVDAVAIPCRPGTLLTLANHTLQPLTRLELRWRSSQTVAKVESVRVGAIPFDVVEDGCVRFTLPLEASDFVLVTER